MLLIQHIFIRNIELLHEELYHAVTVYLYREEIKALIMSHPQNTSYV